MTTATIGERFQVVIPRLEREALGLKPKTKVSVEARGSEIVMRVVGVERMRGMGKALADDIDATDYVRQLRDEWERGA